MENAIVIPENVWANCQFSLARHTGKIRVDGHEYIIVDKRGHDIFECSLEAEKAGREKAIEPGEPADLCRTDFVQFYRKLGRDRFLAFLHDCPWVKSVPAARSALPIWERNGASV